MADKIKKEKIFINAMDSWFSNFLIETFRTDHLPDSKYQTEFMGTINDKIKNRLPMYFKPNIYKFDYNTSYKSEIFSNDVIIYNLNTGCIKEIDYIIHGLKTLKFDTEKILIIISNIMTWSKTSDKIKSDNPEEIIFIHPEDFKKEELKEEIKENEENKDNIEENNENNIKTIINEENKTKEEINKDNKNEIKENEANISKVSKTEKEQILGNLSKKISKNNLDEIKEEKVKPVIVYYTEKDYLKRKPNHKYIEYKYVENEALLLNSKTNVKAYVLCPGIIYGYGEKFFYSFFRNAILNLPIEEIILDKGRNIIPTIHMKDLINIISKIIEKKPNSYYLLAFDYSKNRSLKYIIQSIYDCIGDINKMIPPIEEELIDSNEENKEEENKTENEEKKDTTNNNKSDNADNNEGKNNEQLEKEGYNEEKIVEEQIEEKKKTFLFADKKFVLQKYFPRELLSIDLKILPSEFLKGEPKKSYYNESDDENKEKDKIIEYTPLFKWHCPEGIVSNPQSIRKEFIKYRNLNSNKVIILGNPYTGKTELSRILSKIFHLPIINSKIIFEFGKKLANKDNTNNGNKDNQFQGGQRKNSIEKDLIYDIQRTFKELDEGRVAAEENYNKRKDKKKTDPPFDDNMYYRFNDEMMVRILKRRLQENDTSIYGFILDGFPKNHNQAGELFEDISKGGMIPNSIIIFDNVEDDYIINRIKNSETFPKDLKDPQATAILERANRRLNKIKENKTQEGYMELIDFFKQEQFENLKILVLDTKKEIIDLVKETQEFIISNNDNTINQIDEMLNCTDYQYDFIKEQAELEKQKKEELKKEEEENEKNKKDKKGEEKDNKNNDEKNSKNNVNEDIQEYKIEEKKEEEEKEENKKEEIKSEEKKNNDMTEEEKKEEIVKTPKTQYEIEKENEFKLLEKKSEILRRYLAENVLPILSLGILHVANERPDDPVESLADFLLAKNFEIEKEEKEKKNNVNNNKEENEVEQINEKANKEEINNKEINNENKEINNENKDNKGNIEQIKEEDKGKDKDNLEKKLDSLEIDFNISEAKEF